MNTLKLSRPLVNTILSQAQQSPNIEVCGLLGGKEGQALSCYPVYNQAKEPSHQYHMEPAQQINALRQMREADEELVAIYHSHPNTPALPSNTDIAEASYPEAAYLIISLNTVGVLEMSAFYISEGKSRGLNLELA